MAWWDYGYQITGIANRTTIADVSRELSLLFLVHLDEHKLTLIASLTVVI